MALTTEGYIGIATDRFLMPVVISRLTNGQLHVELKYTVRVGAVDTHHLLWVDVDNVDSKIKSAYNSLFYAVNNSEDGNVDWDYVPFGLEEPPA